MTSTYSNHTKSRKPVYHSGLTKPHTRSTTISSPKCKTIPSRTKVSWIFISIAGVALLINLVFRELEPNTLTYSCPKSNSVPTATNYCDLYNGTWIHDPTIKPSYTEECPFMSSKRKCQTNGRPDKDYLNWRWKPSQCDLPPFDPVQFLGLMSEQTIAFIGDSISWNFMESLLCSLRKTEIQVMGSNRRMRMYTFEQSFVKIVRIGSSRLVNETHGDFGTNDTMIKINLDVPDQHFIDMIPQFNVIVLSSGPWFNKPAIQMLRNEYVHLNMRHAYGIAMETILDAIVTHPHYKGITILSSYSPEHFEGGNWNGGGTCSKNVAPFGDGELALMENKVTNAMHEETLRVFENAMKKKRNKSKLRLLDMTRAFEFRRDGHPGRYDEVNPANLPEGKPRGGGDCLHWCMPGPLDTWIQFMLQIWYVGK